MTQIVAPTHPFDVAVELSPSWAHPASSWATPPPRTRTWWVRSVASPPRPCCARSCNIPNVWATRCPLTVNFAGPIADGAFEVSARPTRTNRSTQHWNIELAQDGVVTTTATAVFGNRRDTWASTEIEAPPPRPPMTWPLQVSPTSSRGRAITRCGSSRRAPQSRSGRTAGFDDHDVGARRPAASAGLSGTDIAVRVFYPRAFLRLGRYLPAGTVSLTVYFTPTRRCSPRRPTTPSSPPPSAAVRKGLLRPVR